MAFSGSNNVSAPGRRHVEITPSDTEDLNPLVRYLEVGGEGNIALMDEADVVVVRENVSGVVAFRAKRVMATDTTATNIIGCW